MALRDELLHYSVCEIRPVEVIKDDHVANAAIYASKILRINDDRTIDFSIPLYLGEPVELKRNTRYSFLFIHEQAMKVAQGVFLQRIRIDNVPMAEVRLVTELRKIQRRDYYRLGCHIEMMFQVINVRKEELYFSNFYDEIVKKLDDDRWKLGTILDISGGGMKFISDAPIIDLPYLFMTFFLGDNMSEQVGVTGKLLSRLPVPRSLQCTHRVQFEPEHSKAQDRILAYVYAEQRKLAKH